jgi:hypothetical protein
MIKVAKLKVLGEYRLRATFSDGMAGEYDFAAIVAESGPMVEPLRDPAFLARVFLDDGAPTWPNGFDASPVWLRREIEREAHLRGMRRLRRAPGAAPRSASGRAATTTPSS